MNSLVERLRQYALPDPHDEREVMHAPLLKETADLIEQQAARIAELEAWRDSWVKCPEGAAAQRIKELEAYNQTRTDELLAATRRIAELTSMVDEHGAEMWVQGEEYAILSCKCAEQYQRIEELEAELGAGHLQCIADRQKYKQELAALRRRIDDAPVVAWANKDRGLISAWEKAHYTEMKALGSPGGERWLKGEDAERHTIPLISKEDLK